MIHDFFSIEPPDPNQDKENIIALFCIKIGEILEHLDVSKIKKTHDLFFPMDQEQITSFVEDLESCADLYYNGYTPEPVYGHKSKAFMLQESFETEIYFN